MSKSYNDHTPVLLSEILEIAQTEFKGDQVNYLDVTFGRGGHAKALKDQVSMNKIIALDQDQQAIEFGKDLFAEDLAAGDILFLKSNFSRVLDFESEIQSFTNQEGVSLVLADLGVSSPQLDDPSRGFSFYNSGPLDMRMDMSHEVTAADIVNEWSEEELVDLFIEKGEIRRPQRVVDAIINRREKGLFKTTGELSELIVSTLGWRKKGVHPATQVFLALRLEVNKELEVVEKSMESLVKLMKPGGLLFVITFHSLEDRIVKYKFKELALEYGEIVNKKVIQAKWAEKKKNKRARSAKLRVFRRT